MKKITLYISCTLFLLFGVYKLIVLMKPSVEVINNYNQTIISVICHLPNSKIEMDSIATNKTNKILYGLKQNKGTLKYQITFEDGSIVNGNCDSIKSYDFFKRTQIIINKTKKVDCIK